MIKVFCDRCGVERGKEDDALNTIRVGTGCLKKEIDLCLECYEGYGELEAILDERLNHLRVSAIEGFLKEKGES